MKIMKKLSQRVCAAMLLAVVGLAAVCPAAFAAKAQLPDLPTDQRVVDDANVLSNSTTQTIENLNLQLQEQCSGAQIGVLTVEYTGSLTTEEYATEAFNTWGVGNSSKNNGVLILLVMESPDYDDGDYYLTYGIGFRNTTLEKQASAIAQTMEDDFAAKDYDDAVVTCAQNVADTIADIYGVTLSASTGGSTETTAEPDRYSYNESYGRRSVMSSLITLIATIIVVIALFCIFIAPIGHSFGWYWGPFGWFGWRRRRGPRPPRGPHDPYDDWGFGGSRGPRGPRGPRPPRNGGGSRPPCGGFGGGGGRSGGGSFRGGGGSLGGMGGGRSMGGGGGRGR